jgi:hypothetical protein
VSTASDTATPDPLVAEIGRLAAYDVPVSVDVARAARDGRRRIHRRQVRVGAAVALSGAAAVTAGAVAWPLTGAEHARDGGTGVVDSPTVPTTPTPTLAEWTWYDQPVLEVGGVEVEGNRLPTVTPTNTPGRQLRAAGVETGWMSGGSFTPESSASFSWAGPVLSDERAGYVEFAVRRLAGEHLCDLQVAPPAATGRTCYFLDDSRGAAAVIEFAESEQGPTRLVVAEHGGYTAVVAYSLGFPVTDRETYDPNAIHWSGRGPYENSTATAAPLTSMPTSLEVQISFAWAQLGTGS